MIRNEKLHRLTNHVGLRIQAMLSQFHQTRKSLQKEKMTLWASEIGLPNTSNNFSSLFLDILSYRRRSYPWHNLFSRPIDNEDQVCCEQAVVTFEFPKVLQCVVIYCTTLFGLNEQQATNPYLHAFNHLGTSKNSMHAVPLASY
mmetsp:Transcript_26599/g.43735  ORF Transcript_26599/g.43735 Transcript_26599/m.43735 type:complete len:144 (-) Transcript_26599:31-462(-)